MKKEFITYEQALALKELGFDEPCFGYWKMSGWLIEEKTRTDGYTHADQLCSASLFQQAFRWFREKYNIISSTRTHFNEEFFYEIYVDDMNEITSDYYNTYEEAELACLNKLIELAKQ